MKSKLRAANPHSIGDKRSRHNKDILFLQSAVSSENQKNLNSCSPP